MRSSSSRFLSIVISFVLAVSVLVPAFAFAEDESLENISSADQLMKSEIDPSKIDSDSEEFDVEAPDDPEVSEIVEETDSSDPVESEEKAPLATEENARNRVFAHGVDSEQQSVLDALDQEYEITSEQDFAEALTAIKADDSTIDFKLILKNNFQISGSQKIEPYKVSVNGVVQSTYKNVILTTDGPQYTITQTGTERHFIFEGLDFTIENVTLDGRGVGGGIQMSRGDLNLIGSTSI